MPLNKDLREFLELLNSNGVEYLVSHRLLLFTYRTAEPIPNTQLERRRYPA
jgi:hypothetical protein